MSQAPDEGGAGGPRLNRLPTFLAGVFVGVALTLGVLGCYVDWMKQRQDQEFHRLLKQNEELDKKFELLERERAGHR